MPELVVFSIVLAIACAVVVCPWPAAVAAGLNAANEAGKDICTICLQEGHTASSCPKRERWFGQPARDLTLYIVGNASNDSALRAYLKQKSGPAADSILASVMKYNACRYRRETGMELSLEDIAQATLLTAHYMRERNKPKPDIRQAA